ncbi:MAG: UvrD-helicase domain-containing protein [Lachnospiraceae bacterium]|nr:UvrD-helicase domain-containing protein [Lachnospiraceae bacterium]
MDYLSTLNQMQLKAVMETEGYLRVIAGAGSGKTKLLVSRYAYLVNEYGINSANILCVTFTNKAAAEMKRRIKALIGDEYDTSLICTYHGFCVRVLREDVEKIFFPKEFQIIDNTQQKAILSEIYQKYELKLDHASFEKILKIITAVKAKRSYVSKMCCTDKCQIMDEIKTLDEQIVEDFMQHQKQIYALDFSDLLYFTLDMLERCPDVLDKWQNKLNYIQVDEFQDSSKVEMELVDMLSAKHKNLMIVGDPDQNIYEWRGSDVKLLVDFDKVHIPTNTVFLNQNYRSTPQILKCANTLIEKNEYRLKKDLYTEAGDGVPVYHFHTKNEYEEVDKIVENINRIRNEQKCNFSDFAILYRSGFLSRIVEKKLTEVGIPYEIFGGVKFYHRMEIQDIMAYLRLIAFDDDIAFKRIINTPRRRFGRMKLQHLAQLQKNDMSYYQTLKEHINDSAFANSGAREFVNIIENIRNHINELKVTEIVEKVCSDSGYEKYIRELGDMERFENLSEFKRIATEYERNLGEEVSLKEFINQISLQSEDDGDESCDMVKMMTIHSSKGLEFPYVFVLGFSEGIFPSAKTIEERKKLGLEEERRLCYVAITRAEKRLFLLDSEGYNQNGKEKYPSRFLKEIGEDNYIRVGNISRELQENANRYATQLFEETPDTSVKAVNDKVTHPAFGEGTILGYGKNKGSYLIRFDKLQSEREISVDFFNRKREIPLKVAVDQNSFTNVADTAVSNAVAPAPTTAMDRKNHETTNMDKKIPEGYEKVEEKKVSELKPVGGNGNQQPGGQSDSPQDIQVPRQNVSTDNLWERDDVPKTGWVCTGVSDLGAPVGICQMCGHQIIRYVHHMYHAEYGSLDVGCVCAGKMEGNIDRAKRREQDFKNKQSRKENFHNRKWRTSKNNNSYLKVKDHLIVLYYNKNYDNWKYSIDNVFCKEVFAKREEAVDAAFEALEDKLGKESRQ